MKVLSFDAETNGLWGRAFAIGAVALDPSSTDPIEYFRARIPLHNPDPWVAENVIPNLSMPITHETYERMLGDFIKFLLSHKGYRCLTHMGYIVEARLLRDAYTDKMLGDWDAPYPLYDISGNLDQIGNDPTSVDAYCRKNNISIPGNSHDPVYDSLGTALAYYHLIAQHEYFTLYSAVSGKVLYRHADSAFDIDIPHYLSIPYHMVSKSFQSFDEIYETYTQYCLRYKDTPGVFKASMGDFRRDLEALVGLMALETTKEDHP